MEKELKRHYMLIVDFLGHILGPDYEIALHELNDDSNEIIAIANGELTGRHLGSPLSNRMLEYVAGNLYETQKQAGYDDGAALAREELEKQSIDHQEQYQKQCQELEADYRTKQESMEADLVDAIIQVFDKVFHIQFGNKKEILLYLIKNTLGSIDAGKHFRILVSEDNWKYVDEHLDELREELGSDVTIETARDRSMNNTECRIETDFGVYDCGVDLELDALCRDIRSLCS